LAADYILCDPVGVADGEAVGATPGSNFGARVGFGVGSGVGATVGTTFGARVGFGVGSGVGVTTGSILGARVGMGFGSEVGTGVGVGSGAACFRRRLSVLSAVFEDDGSVAVIFTVTICWPGSAAIVTEIRKFPRGPAVVLPLNCPVPDCSAPAVTLILAFGAVVPSRSNVRPTVAFSPGKRMVRKIGAGAALRTVKGHERSNGKPARPRPVTCTLWLPKSSGAGGL
jgi:hypothetical protein